MSKNDALQNHQGIVSTRYVGPKDRLFEKAALVKSSDDPATVLAQFNDYKTGMATGWHPLPRTDFAMWAPQV